MKIADDGNGGGADGGLEIAAARRGFSLIYRGKPLLSLIDPVKQAERAVQALLPLKERTLYFCPSPLFGYALDFFLDGLPESSALLCLEAEESLYQWSLGHCLPLLRAEGAKKRLIFIKADKKVSGISAIYKTVRENWGARCFRRIEEFSISLSRALHSGLYDEIAEGFRAGIALEWSNAMTLTKLGRLYIRNFFRNLCSFGRGRDLASFSFGTKPVLAAGAGPSLDALLNVLAPLGGAQDRKARPYTIIAVDTALGAFLERGIKPDLTVALEAQHWNLDDFSGLGRGGIPLALDMSALSSQARFAEERPYFFWTAWTELKLFSRLKKNGLLPLEMPALGSVGLCAALIALKLSRGPVLLSGLDFSFTPDNYHTRGSPSHKAALRRCGRFGGLYHSAAVFRAGTQAELSKSARPVRTDPSMQRYQKLFLEELSARPQFSKRLFEVEGSGLSLGVEVLGLPEAVGLLGGFQISDFGFQISEGGGQGGEDFYHKGEEGARRGIAEGEGGEFQQKVLGFLQGELSALCRIRAILTGGGECYEGELLGLIDEADYLWAHFPDCASRGGLHPELSDASFLKRLRAELDPFIDLIKNLTTQRF